MNIHHCCPIKTRAVDNVRRPASRLRRGGELAGWIVPSVTLTLLPKCPVCVAAYVALATGIGISLPTATYLRTMLMVLCVVSLIFIVARRLRSFLILRGVKRWMGSKLAKAPLFQTISGSTTRDTASTLAKVGGFAVDLGR